MFENYSAVVIGTNYQNSSASPGWKFPQSTKPRQLQYAKIDAEAVAATLSASGYAVHEILGEGATRVEIIVWLDWYRKNTGPKDLLLVYFAGHGALDEDDHAYLVPDDADLVSLPATAIRLDDLVRRHLNGITNVVTILDCCHSGYAVGVRSGDSTQVQWLSDQQFAARAVSAFDDRHGRVVLAACGGSQKVPDELATRGHGPFTFYLLEHWNNSPQAVTPYSLFAHADEALQKEGLPRPVYGAWHQGVIELRTPRPVEHITSTHTPDSHHGPEAEVPTLLQRESALDRLRRASYARSMERWQALGVARDVAAELAQDPEVGKPTDAMIPNENRRLVLLVGELGSGKSLLGERIHQLWIDTAKADPYAPVPVHLRARDLVGRLEPAVRGAAQNLGDPAMQGASIVIDGADEAGLAAAAEMLSQARVLVEQWPRTTVLITARPIPRYAEAEECVQVPLLSEENSFDLIARIAAKKSASKEGGNNDDSTSTSNKTRRRTIYGLDLLRRLTSSVADAIRRPLFAILAGAYLRDMPAGRRPSKIELVEHMVEHSLGGLSIAPTQASHLLRRLAVLSTDREGRAVPRHEVATGDDLSALLATRLVVEHAGTLSFALPLHLEWFAAQSLAMDDPTPGALIADPIRLERWRFALVTYLGTSSYELASKLLNPLVRAYPGVASSLIKDSLSSWGAKDAIALPSALECGNQIIQAMAAWCEGIGPLGLLIVPAVPEGMTLSLAISTHPNGQIQAAWYRRTASSPQVFPFTADMLRQINLYSAGQGPEPAGLVQYSSETPANVPAWPWKWALDHLNYTLRSNYINEYELPLRDGPLVQESAWRTALALLDNRDETYTETRVGPDGEPQQVIVSKGGWMDQSPIPLDQLEQLLVQHTGPYYETRPSGYAFEQDKQRRFTLHHLRQEVSRLRACGTDELRSPWPIADLEYPSDLQWDWQLFSPEQILARAKAIYGGALEGYQQLVATWFPRLADSLRTWTLLPAHVVGIVSVPQKGPDGKYPGNVMIVMPSITFYFEPLPQGSSTYIDFRLGTEDETYNSEWEDAILDELGAKQRKLRPNAAGWLYPSLSRSALDIFYLSDSDKWAATELAYSWLSDDLDDIGWNQKDNIWP